MASGATNDDSPEGAHPDDSGSNPSEFNPPEAFYTSYWFVYSYTLLAGSAGCITIIAIEIQASFDRRDLQGIAAGLTVAAAINLLLVALACRLFPVTVSTAGIRSYNTWAIFRTVAWDDVVSVRRINLAGLRYLLIAPHQGASLWVPLFLSNWPRFVDRVRAEIDEDHPLDPFLER